MTPTPAEQEAKEIDEIATMLDSVGDKYINWERQLCPIARKVYEYTQTREREARRLALAEWQGEVQALTEERNTLRAALAGREGALEYMLLADEIRELREQAGWASRLMDEVLAHTRILPANGRRLTMKGHGKAYDAALERLRVTLAQAPTPTEPQEGKE